MIEITRANYNGLAFNDKGQRVMSDNEILYYLNHYYGLLYRADGLQITK